MISKKIRQAGVQSAFQWLFRKIIFCLVCLLLSGCSGEKPDEWVFFDFETDTELDRVHWKCRTLFSRSNDHSAHGNWALKLDFYPSPYPGFSPMVSKNDWSRYQGFAFNVFNPSNTSLRLTVRIDDKKETPAYNDRYNKTFVIKPGHNMVTVPFSALKTSRTHRSLDLKNIYRFLVFMVQPEKTHTLYLDYFRLLSL